MLHFRGLDLKGQDQVHSINKDFFGHFWQREVFEALRALGFKFRDGCKRI